MRSYSHDTRLAGRRSIMARMTDLDKMSAKNPQGVEAQFAAILADATKLYTDSSVKGPTLNEFLTPPMKSVSDLTLQLTIQNDQFSHFREKRQKIFDVVGAALRPVELIGDIVAEGASEVFPPTQGIFAAVMYLINAAHDVSAMYDSILDLFEKLKDFTSRLDVYLNHTLSPALHEKLVTILATLFEVLVIATKAARHGRLKAYFKKLIGIESPVQAALQKLNDLTLGEERQAIAETHGGVAELNLKSDRVEDMIAQMSQNVLDLRLGQHRNSGLVYREKLRDILEPTPYAEDSYAAFAKHRIQGTGDWLLEDEGMKSWLQGESQYLWICGNPGTGKSFLTSRVITWGLENLAHLGYFFFSANDPETRSVLQALRDVAYQLSENDAIYAEKLARQLRSSDEIKTIPSAFRRLFVQPLQDDNRDTTLYIFFDGIDEADQSDVEQLLSLLAPGDESESESESRLRLQFAFTGRSYLAETVSAALDPNSAGQVFTTIYVTPECIADDVSAFITDGVRRSRILSRSPEDFKQEVIESMKKQVDGLFILAKFMLNEINQKRHPSSILKSLKSFPKEINGMLNETLANLSITISEEDARDLTEMLQWVSCAEESLTLEQLEAALIMRFGDPPLRLEESLRGQYACFFALEREDGLTTDDLVKDFARTQREAHPEGSHSPSPSPRLHALSGSRTSSPRRGISPMSRDSCILGTSPPTAELPSPRHFSPARSPGILDTSNEIEFRSNPSTTYVTFCHASVRQFFRESSANITHATKGGVAIGFDLMTARINILKACLRIFNDKAWFDKLELDHGKEAIKQYAAWYWQEHLAALDPATVPPEDKKELGMRIFNMLTMENVIYDWSIMYEKNDEGLEVLTDSNIQALHKWLNDDGILMSFTAEAKDFVTNQAKEDLGICQAIGRFYAKQWLSEDFISYVPTLFCFNIVQNVAFMSDGHPWSQAQIRWSEMPIEDRVRRAIEWANYPPTAHSHRRLGSTYLMLERYSDALMQYNKVLELDPNNVGTAGRIAYCLSKYGHYSEALAQALKCAEIEEKSIRDGSLQGFALTSCNWRLYKDYLLVARCSYLTGKMEPALKYFRQAIDSAPDAHLNSSERFEAEVEYLGMLASANLHSEMMSLLQGLAKKADTAGKGKESDYLIDLLLQNCDKPLVMDWIPKAACKTGQVEFILNQFDMAIETARGSNQMGVLYLRLAYGTTLAYHRDLDGSIEIFERISLIEYRPRGNVPTRHGHATSFQKLSALYKQKILQADLKSSEAMEWIQKLEQIQEKQSKNQNFDVPAEKYGSDVNIASVYLALFYRLLKDEPKARQLLGNLIINSLDLLLDDEPRNDRYAVENLLQAFIAANDTEDAQALARSMRKVNRAAAMATPLASPTLTRIEPKLPDIQSVDKWCAQCLNNISSTENLYLCRFCVDAYCEKCLSGIIRQPGNKTCDRRMDIVCRNDHDWFTIQPLNQFLHTGEILWGDGMVKDFREWENALRERWHDIGLRSGNVRSAAC